MQLDDKQTTLLERLSGLLSPTQYDTTYLTHGIHPYPAKYIPQLPREIILEHSNERNTILDPFCGSGTTLLEASSLGRKSIGVDSNPIATLISRVKTQPLSAEEVKVGYDFSEVVCGVTEPYDLPVGWVPTVKNLEHWFQQNVIRELSWLKSNIDMVDSDRLREFLLCIFSSIIVSVSNQESDTRYAAKNKAIDDGYVLKRFSRKLNQELRNVIELSNMSTVRRNPPQILTLDVRRLDATVLGDNTIDLVVTSPPYPNSYDYYLYHKLRMYWLGYEPSLVKDIEIGSRNEHSSRRAPIDSFIAKMIPVMSNVSRVLKPSKLAYFFVGDSIISGEFINMKDVFEKIAQSSGLALVADSEYGLDRVTRSFHEKKSSVNRNQHQKMQRILVFEPITSRKSITVDRVMASPTANLKQMSLDSSIPDGATIAIQSEDVNRHIHSLGKYPSKFIPDIPRWAISYFSQPGDRVLDPFSGSGTTSVEAMVLSRHAFGADISPYACLLTSAKTTKVSSELLGREVAKIERALSDARLLPERGRLHFEYDTFWFNESYLAEIESIKHFITEAVHPSMRNFFLAVLSTTIKPSSYLDESQVKVKRDPKKLLKGTPAPTKLMRENLVKYANRLVTFNELLSDDSRVQTEIFHVSASDLCPTYIQQESIDLVVTSPPYINAMNYPMTHRYENILLGLLDADENINHQTQYFGTERVYSRDFRELRSVDESWSSSSNLNAALAGIFEKERKRSYIAYRYFINMYETFRGMFKLLKPGGKLVLVAGTNTIRGVHVDTFNILVSMLQDIGFDRQLSFHYEIIKNAFKLRRHETADLIKLDGVAVMEKRR